MAWSVTIDGETVTDEQIRVAEYVDIESRTGIPWGDLNPARSATQAFHILSVMYEVRRELTIAESAMLVGQMTAGQVLEHFGGEPATPLAAA